MKHAVTSATELNIGASIGIQMFACKHPFPGLNGDHVAVASYVEKYEDQ